MLCAKLRNLETLIAPIVPSNTRRITIETKTTTLDRYGKNNESDRLFEYRNLALSQKIILWQEGESFSEMRRCNAEGPHVQWQVLREMNSLGFLFAEKKPVMARFPLRVFPIDCILRNSMHKEQSLP